MYATIPLALALLLLPIAPATASSTVSTTAPSTQGPAAALARVASSYAWRHGETALTIDCAAFTSATAGTPRAGGTTGTITITRNVTMGDHGTLVVTLCSNQSTGYRWDAPGWTRQLLKYAGRSATAPAAGALGAAGTETFRFRARHAGSGTIRLTYSQPWAGGEKATWRVIVRVRALRSAPVVRPVSASVSVTCDAFTAAADQSGHAALTRTANASVGGTVTVTLCSNPSTGFAWETPVFDATKLQLTRHATNEATSGLLGAAGTETWTFKVLATGDPTVSFAYSRPWAGGEKGLWTVALTVHVAK
jgi:predicted secreted protein